MQIIEIVALENGAHRNQSGDFRTIPEGWAVVPYGETLENFPFGTPTVEEINGVMTVTAWEAGEMPEPEQIPEPEQGDSTIEERVTALENAIAEGLALYEEDVTDG